MDTPPPANRGRTLRLVSVAALWFITLELLTRYAAFALPRSLAAQLSLELYLVLVQLVTIPFGLGLAVALLKRDAFAELGIRWPKGKSLAFGLALAPSLFAAASYLAVYLALPTLLEEIRRGGAELVRSNAGQVGQAMRQAPVLLVLLWGVVVAPLGEELLFRGAVWGALQRVVHAWFPSSTAPAPSLPGQFIEPSLLLSALRGVGSWLRHGGVATLLSGVAFGLLHWDMPGGQGIIRVTATTCLGLACGVARQASRSVVVPIVVHASFNLLGVAGARRWLVSESFPTHYMVPTLGTLLGALGAVVAIAIVVALRDRKLPPASG